MVSEAVGALFRRPLGETSLACSHVLSAVGTQDVVLGREKATAYERHAALLAIEAVVVPLALLKGNILAAAKTWGHKEKGWGQEVMS